MKEKCEGLVIIVFHVDEPILWWGWALLNPRCELIVLHWLDHLKAENPANSGFSLQAAAFVDEEHKWAIKGWAKTMSSSLCPHCEALKGFQLILGDTGWRKNILLKVHDDRFQEKKPPAFAQAGLKRAENNWLVYLYSGFALIRCLE